MTNRLRDSIAYDLACRGWHVVPEASTHSGRIDLLASPGPVPLFFGVEAKGTLTDKTLPAAHAQAARYVADLLPSKYFVKVALVAESLPRGFQTGWRDGVYVTDKARWWGFFVDMGFARLVGDEYGRYGTPQDDLNRCCFYMATLLDKSRWPRAADGALV